MLSLSTCWLPYRGAIIHAAFDAARRLGFRAVELGVSDADFIAEDLKEIAEARGVSILSVHNLVDRAGLPPKEYRGDGLGSPREAERRRAVERTLHSMEVAQGVGARTVVLHLGAVDVPDAAARQSALGHRLASGEDRGAVLADARRITDERRLRAQPFVGAARASIADLLARGPRGVSLGIETRYHIHEVPDFHEMGGLLAEFPPDRVGYWHDTGHAMAQETMGVVTHEEWFDRYGARLIGVHLHDAVSLSDHRPPGTGEVDFAMIRRHVRPDTLAVIEMRHDVPMDAVREGKSHLEGLGFVP